MTTQRRQTQFIRQVLYTLKRGYGFPVVFHKIISEDIDKQTGKRDVTIQTQRVRLGIVLPASLMAKFEYDLAYTASNRNFTYGGGYGTSTRRIIIDARDLNNFEIELDDYFIYEGKRWQVSKIVTFEFDTGFIVHGREVKGTPRNFVQEQAVEDNLQLTESVLQT
jgi:hypothetical protein